MKKFSLTLTLLIAMIPAMAAVDVREFSSEENRERYHQLVDELRCPKCQNQNLAGSDSPIAKDLRRELYRLIEEGHSDAEIKTFMVRRYGDYVLYRPPVQRNTLLLWWGPPIVFGLGILVVLIIAWRRRRLLSSDTATDLSPDDQERLDRLLAQEDRAVGAEPGSAEADPKNQNESSQ